MQNGAGPLAGTKSTVSIHQAADEHYSLTVLPQFQYFFLDHGTILRQPKL